MSDIPPSSSRPSRPLREDEWVALVVAFLGAGAIAAWVVVNRLPQSASWGLGREVTENVTGAAAAPARSGADLDGAMDGNGAPSNLENAKQAVERGVSAASSKFAIAQSERSSSATNAGADTANNAAGAPSSTPLDDIDDAAATAAKNAAGTAAGTAGAPAAPAESPAAPVLDFQDLPDDHWARPFILSLAKQGIVSGFEDGRFQPDRPVTRAEFATLLTGVFGDRPPASSSKTFNDVADDYWGKEAISRAVQLGFMKGYPDGSFKPDRPIPYLEMTIALSTGLQLAPPSNPQEVLSRFSDGRSVPTWAAPKVAAAAASKLLANHPTPETLNIADPTNRDRVAVALYQTQVLTKTAPPIESRYLFP